MRKAVKGYKIKSTSGRGQFVAGEKRRAAEFGDIRQKRPPDGAKGAVLVDLGRGFDENKIRARLDIRRRALDRLRRRFDGQRVGAGHNLEAVVWARVDGGFDAVLHLLAGGEIFVGAVAAAFGPGLVFNVDCGGAGARQSPHRAGDCRGGAEARVGVDQKRQIDDGGDLRGSALDIAQMNHAQIGQAQIGGDAAARQIQRAKTGARGEQREIRIDCARDLQRRFAPERRRQAARFAALARHFVAAHSEAIIPLAMALVARAIVLRLAAFSTAYNATADNEKRKHANGRRLARRARITRRAGRAARAKREGRMIAQELEESIQFAYSDARQRGLEYVTVEHLVFALLDNSDVKQVAARQKADLAALRGALARHLETRVPLRRGGEPSQPTAGFQRVIQRAVAQTRGARPRAQVTALSVLAAVYAEADSFAAYYLQKHGLERLAIMNHLALQRHTAPDSARAIEAGVETKTGAPAARNLVEWAAAGKLDAPFGRQDEIDQVARVLCRKYKNNPLLVGEPGVGKTAVVHGVAHCVAQNRAPPALAGMAIFEVNIADLVAGTKYRGDFEQRIKDLLERVAQAGNAAIFIDEIHAIVGAGTVSGGALDAANILKPALTTGGARCIGATTYAEFRRLFEKDGAIARRFQKIEIAEPDGDELTAILEGVRTRLESHHKIAYARESVAAAVSTTRRFVADKFLPDKAIDALDEAGAARQMIRAPTTDADADESPAAPQSPIAAADIEDVVSRLTGLPRATVRADERAGLADLEARLAARVVRQPEAVAAVAGAVRRARFGLSESSRAAGAFLFAGPTGVGKTELARQLAAILGAPLLRFDMSEYMERHTVSRLLGAPPGYVGFEQSGLLTEAVTRRPHAVALFDEIEKAHPDIHNVLLQVMDNGALTDAAGTARGFSARDFDYDFERRGASVGARAAGIRARRGGGGLERNGRIAAVVFAGVSQPLGRDYPLSRRCRRRRWRRFWSCSCPICRRACWRKKTSPRVSARACGGCCARRDSRPRKARARCRGCCAKRR